MIIEAPKGRLELLYLSLGPTSQSKIATGHIGMHLDHFA